MLSTLPILAICRMTSLTVESLWLSGRALECGIQRSKVPFFTGLRIFFCPMLVTRQKKVHRVVTILVRLMIIFIDISLGSPALSGQSTQVVHERKSCSSGPDYSQFPYQVMHHVVQHCSCPLWCSFLMKY